MKRAAVIFAVAVLVAACAKSPDEIAPVAAPPDAYSTLNCDGLKKERVTVSQKIQMLSASQQSAATNDAIGVFLLGLPLASMSGADKEAELASAKGDLQAIDRQLVAKECQ